MADIIINSQQHKPFIFKEPVKAFCKLFGYLVKGHFCWTVFMQQHPEGFPTIDGTLLVFLAVTVSDGSVGDTFHEILIEMDNALSPAHFLGLPDFLKLTLYPVRFHCRYIPQSILYHVLILVTTYQTSAKESVYSLDHQRHSPLKFFTFLGGSVSVP